MTHEELIKAVNDAIENLFSDTSVAQITTMDDLGDIIDHVNSLMDTLNP